MRAYLVVTVLAAILIVPRAAAAQAAAAPPVANGDRIRVHLGGVQVVGSAVLVGDSLMIRNERGTAAVPLDSRVRLERSLGRPMSGRRALVGAVAGAAIGIGTGIWLGYQMGDTRYSYDNCWPTGGTCVHEGLTAGEKALTGAVLLGLAGASGGLLIAWGGRPERWQDVPLARPEGSVELGLRDGPEIRIRAAFAL